MLDHFWRKLALNGTISERLNIFIFLLWHIHSNLITKQKLNNKRYNCCMNYYPWKVDFVTLDRQRQLFTRIHGNVECEGRQKCQHDHWDDDVEQIVGWESLQVDVELYDRHSLCFTLSPIHIDGSILYMCTNNTAEMESEEMIRILYIHRC